jgi:hypothetical protein
MLERREIDPFVEPYPRLPCLLSLLLTHLHLYLLPPAQRDRWRHCTNYCLTEWREELLAYTPVISAQGVTIRPPWADWVLIEACKKPQLDSVKILLDWGCRPNAYIPQTGESPLATFLMSNDDWQTHVAPGLELLRAAGLDFADLGFSVQNILCNLRYLHPQAFLWLIRRGALSTLSPEEIQEFKRKLMRDNAPKRAYRMVDLVRFYADRQAVPLIPDIGIPPGWTMAYRPRNKEEQTV